jgi:alpha-glucoside transport system substrate-binding protein
MKQSYGTDLLNTFTVNGKLYGFFETASLEGLIWFNAKQYTGPKLPKDWAELEAWADKTASSGTTPWCIGIESGATSGWPATNWITEILLRQAGPEKYDQWWQGKLAWSSPEVKAAFQTYGKIATNPKLVYGGPIAVLATSFANGGDGMFSNPPSCYLHHQASFYGSIVGGNFPKLKAIDDVDFFPAPDFSTQYPGLFQISGDAMVMFNDTPQVRALVTYAASVEAQTLLAATGGWLSPNRQLSASVYPDPYNRKAGGVIQNAKSVRIDGSLLLPGPMISAYLKAATRYVQNPDQLDAILNDLDAVQKDSYK